MNEIVEIVYQWHQGNTIKGIKRSLKFDRKTIRKYILIAQQLGVRKGEPFPDEQELIKGLRVLSRSPALYETKAIDSIGLYREQISRWLEEKDITAKQIWRLLEEEHELRVGYSSVKRYLKKEFNLGGPKVTVRIETPSGQEAQVDFGYAGLMYDPVMQKDRRAWAFIMTLSYSRHRFVRFVFRMDSPTWIDCHVRAFRFFGGIPATIVLDNLKTGVVKPDIYDPTLHFAYADLERHYGFVADPAKIRSPKLKEKVERVVPVVRKHLLAGRSFKDITEANNRALSWAKDEIGQEDSWNNQEKALSGLPGGRKTLFEPSP